jgi:putative membrane protein
VTLADLPGLNAILNATCLLLLGAGYWAIRARRRDLHRALMLAALAVSLGFLTSYLAYHAEVGTVRYRGTGLLRPVYFALLVSHTVLAASLGLLVPVTLARALRGRFPDHARLARLTLPIWAYVSLTGILVYLLLYRIR